MHDVADDSAARPSPECRALLDAVAALRPVIRGYQDEIERERRLPPPLVAQLRAAGLYRMVLPRALGGLQVDLLTFFRALELAAEGDGAVGWNLGTNALASSAVLSLPPTASARSSTAAPTSSSPAPSGASAVAPCPSTAGTSSAAAGALAVAAASATGWSGAATSSRATSPASPRTARPSCAASSSRQPSAQSSIPGT